MTRKDYAPEAGANTQLRIRELKDLNLMDRFLFAEAIEDEQIYENILEILLGKEVIMKSLPQAEKERRTALWSRQVRLDVYGIDEDGTVYNTEVQKKDTKNLPRRSRFYNAVIDAKLLPSGEVDFNSMADAYVIVICSFDLFGEGKYRYTFNMTCEEDANIKLCDGATRIFFNTKGTDREGVSSELISLLEYFEHSNDKVARSSDSNRIQQINEKVKAIKASEERGVKYMQAWEEKVYDRMEGEKIGERRGLRKGEIIGEARGRKAAERETRLETARRMKAKNISTDMIADFTGLSAEEIEKL